MKQPRERAGALIVELGPAPFGKEQPGGWIAGALELPATRCHVVRPWQGDRIPPIRHYGGVVFSGAAAMITKPEPWHQRAFDWLDTALEAGRPILGICYGHQLIGQVLDADIGWNPNGREIGQTAVTLTDAARDDSLFGELPESLGVFATHSQSVLAVPPRALLLARNEHDGVQAFRWRDHVWGVQFHPEFTARVMLGYLRTQQAELKEEGRNVRALRASVNESGEAARIILNRFARLIR